MHERNCRGSYYIVNLSGFPASPKDVYCAVSVRYANIGGAGARAQKSCLLRSKIHSNLWSGGNGPPKEHTLSPILAPLVSGPWSSIFGQSKAHRTRICILRTPVSTFYRWMYIVPMWHIWKAILEYNIRLKSLNVLLRRSCPFVFFVAHVICTLNVLKHKTIVSAALNKIKSSFYVSFWFSKSLF